MTTKIISVLLSLCIICGCSKPPSKNLVNDRLGDTSVETGKGDTGNKGNANKGEISASEGKDYGAQHNSNPQGGVLEGNTPQDDNHGGNNQGNTPQSSVFWNTNRPFCDNLWHWNILRYWDWRHYGVSVSAIAVVVGLGLAGWWFYSSLASNSSPASNPTNSSPANSSRSSLNLGERIRYQEKAERIAQAANKALTEKMAEKTEQEAREAAAYVAMQAAITEEADKMGIERESIGYGIIIADVGKNTITIITVNTESKVIFNLEGFTEEEKERIKQVADAQVEQAANVESTPQARAYAIRDAIITTVNAIDAGTAQARADERERKQANLAAAERMAEVADQVFIEKIAEQQTEQQAFKAARQAAVREGTDKMGIARKLIGFDIIRTYTGKKIIIIVVVVVVNTESEVIFNLTKKFTEEAIKRIKQVAQLAQEEQAANVGSTPQKRANAIAKAIIKVIRTVQEEQKQKQKQEDLARAERMAEVADQVYIEKIAEQTEQEAFEAVRQAAVREGRDKMGIAEELIGFEIIRTGLGKNTITVVTVNTESKIIFNLIEEEEEFTEEEIERLDQAAQVAQEEQAANVGSTSQERANAIAKAIMKVIEIVKKEQAAAEIIAQAVNKVFTEKRAEQTEQQALDAARQEAVREGTDKMGIARELIGCEIITAEAEKKTIIVITVNTTWQMIINPIEEFTEEETERLEQVAQAEQAANVGSKPQARADAIAKAIKTAIDAGTEHKNEQTNENGEQANK